MPIRILDPWLKQTIIAERRSLGIDQRDEVWDGVYVVPPICDNEHQQLLGDLQAIFFQVCRETTPGIVFPGVNVSDHVDDWMTNFRCPDVVVALNDCPAVDHGTHWVGGLSFVVEIISEGDQSRDKMPFYEKVGVEEVLLIDRFPWGLELYRLDGGKLGLVGRSDLVDPQVLVSAKLPLAFQLLPGVPRPVIKVTAKDGADSWVI